MKMDLPRVKEIIITIVLALIGLVILITSVAITVWYVSAQEPDCNVADLTLYGTLVYYPQESSGANVNANGTTLDQTAAESIRQEIEAANADPSISAILLQIDSPGGDPVAGEDVAAALKNSKKPTVALIADLGTSAAYWAATGAEKIFASANSSVADIGVTESYLDQTQQNTDNGLKFISLVAGQYKDMGNPNAPLTSEERALLQRDLNITYQNFVDQVATNRNLSTSSVMTIANGSSMLGAQAKQEGLIDDIGSIYDVEHYLKGKLGDDVALCKSK